MLISPGSVARATTTYSDTKRAALKHEVTVPLSVLALLLPLSVVATNVDIAVQRGSAVAHLWTPQPRFGFPFLLMRPEHDSSVLLFLGILIVRLAAMVTSRQGRYIPWEFTAWLPNPLQYLRYSSSAFPHSWAQVLYISQLRSYHL